MATWSGDGWLPENPLDLLTPDEHRELNESLARLAQLRRRVEAEYRTFPMG